MMMKSVFEEQDLLNDSKLDEMQKAYAYKLAFRCFKALYWTNVAFTFIPMVFQSMTNKSSFYALTSMLLFLITNIIYLVFGAKASEVGALNPPFAKNMAKPGTIASFLSMFMGYMTFAVVRFNQTGEPVVIYFGIYIAIMTATHIALGVIAKRNNQIAEEAEEEE